jgi:uncharacterized protein
MTAQSLSRNGVEGFLHRFEGEINVGVILTHGAGGNCQAALLVALANVIAAPGRCVLRCDLPFRQKRRSGPPSPAHAAEDRKGLRDAVNEIRVLGARSVVLGGLSYGGRQATMLAAEDPAVADSLALLSYPLHPPGKPDGLRTDHFPLLRVPALFLQGTRDPFASIEEMSRAITLIPAKTELVPIEGVGHDLGRGKSHVSLIAERIIVFASSASSPLEAQGLG